MTLLADGAPHTFAEIFRALEGKIRPDNAIAMYQRENPAGRKKHSLELQILIGKRRIIQYQLSTLKMQGDITGAGRSLEGTYWLQTDPSVKQAYAARRRVIQARTRAKKPEIVDES